MAANNKKGRQLPDGYLPVQKDPFRNVSKIRDLANKLNNALHEEFPPNPTGKAGRAPIPIGKPGANLYVFYTSTRDFNGVTSNKNVYKYLKLMMENLSILITTTDHVKRVEDMLSTGGKKKK